MAINKPIVVEIEGVFDETDDIRRFSLKSTDKTLLPAYEPGAHIDVEVPGGIIRQYSLCGAQGDRQRYQIAVKRELNSRGVCGCPRFCKLIF